MTLPNGTRLREGDVVILHGIVRFDDDTPGEKYVFVTVGETKQVSIPREQIIGIARQKFKVGETVTRAIDADAVAIKAEVLAVDGDHVWVKWPDRTPTTMPASELKLAKDEEDGQH